MTAQKKGRKSWSPAQKLAITDQDPGFRYRWCEKDQANLDKKLAEGWAFVDPTKGLKADHLRPEHVSDGKPQQGAKEYRELVLMALPEEVAQARDRYFQDRTDQQTLGLNAELRRDLKDAARKHGVESAEVYGKTVIE